MKRSHNLGWYFFCLLWGWSFPWLRFVFLTCQNFHFTYLWGQIDKLFSLYFHFLIWICFEILIHLVKSCGACCCSWRATSNCNIHVPLWNSCHGMVLTVACEMVFSTIVFYRILNFIGNFLYSYVEENCLRVFLLVPFCQCHQQQWYAFIPFPETYIL